MRKSGPLAGIRVLDMSQGIAGPSCGGHFAEFGADVIKIEPPEGDWIRALGSRVAGSSSPTVLYNRGKRSIAVDLRKPQGRDIALRIAGTAQVVIESARPGVMERLGLGFGAIREHQPDIVYVSISGFGHRGPNREKPLTDTMAQAKSGLMSVMRSREGAPVKMDAPVIDAVTGLYAFQAASMALWGKSVGSGARHLDISLMQSAAHILGPGILEWDYVGRAPGILNPPAGNYRTKDGWLAVTTVNEEQYRAICRASGRPDLANDPRFDTVAGRKENLPELRRLLDEALATRTTAEWVERFEKEGALGSAIATYGDWLDDPQTIAADSAPSYSFPNGESVRIPHLPGQPPNAADVPGLGEHGASILADLGLDATEIDSLTKAGIVKAG